MALLDEFNASYKPQKGPRCALSALFAKLKPDVAAELQALLDRPEIEHVALARFISAKWPENAVKRGTVSRHRGGECSCGSL